MSLLIRPRPSTRSPSSSPEDAEVSPTWPALQQPRLLRGSADRDRAHEAPIATLSFSALSLFLRHTERRQVIVRCRISCNADTNHQTRRLGEGHRATMQCGDLCNDSQTEPVPCGGLAALKCLCSPGLLLKTYAQSAHIMSVLLSSTWHCYSSFSTSPAMSTSGWKHDRSNPRPHPPQRGTTKDG